MFLQVLQKIEKIKDFFFWLTVHGPCIQGSPSICMGNVFFVVMITSLHCANLLPDERSPVLTWPMCRQFSNPITSIRLSPKSVIALIRNEWEKEAWLIASHTINKLVDLKFSLKRFLQSYDLEGEWPHHSM